MVIEIIGYLNILLIFFLSYVIASRSFVSFLDRIIFTYLIVWADFIFTALILSCFSIMDSYLAYFSISLGILIIGYIFSIVVNLVPCVFEYTSNREPLRFAGYLVLVLIGIIFALNLLTVIIYPPNNWDSMTYHLPRIHLYFSQGHLGHFFTPNERQVFFPFNPTLFQLPVVEYGLSERIFSFINLGSWCIIGLTLYRLSLFFVKSNLSALLSSFFGLTATAVLAQATTTNNDILLGSCVIASIYFLFLWIKHNHNLLLFISCVSLGIALGTKVTAAFFIPGIAVYFLFSMLRKRYRIIFLQYSMKINWKVFICFIVLMLILAMPSYYINYRDSGYLSAPGQIWYVNDHNHLKTAEQNLLGIASQIPLNPIVCFSFNLLRIYDSYNSTTYKYAIPSYVNRLINALWLDDHWDRSLSRGIDYNYINFISRYLVEDEVWYGFASYLLIAGLLVLFLKRKIYSKQMLFILFILFIALFFYLSYGILMRWQPWSNRFFISAFLVLNPILAIAVEHLRHFKKGLYLLYIFIVIAFFESISYLFYNERRPLENFDEPYHYSYNLNLKDLSRYDKLCIVNVSGDQGIYPFMREGKRKKIILSDIPLKGYYNIISIHEDLGKRMPMSDTKCLGEYNGYWYGLDLTGSK